MAPVEDMTAELQNWLSPSWLQEDTAGAATNGQHQRAGDREGAVTSFIEAVGGYSGPAIMSDVVENPSLAMAASRSRSVDSSGSSAAGSSALPVASWGARAASAPAHVAAPAYRTRARTVSESSANRAAGSDSESESAYAPPSHRDSFLQGLEAKLDSVTLGAEEADSPAGGGDAEAGSQAAIEGGKEGTKKKKKKKKLVLTLGGGGRHF